MTREEAIQYAADKLNKGLYRLDLGYLNRGLYQIVAREVDFMKVAISALREQCVRDVTKTSGWISVEERLPGSEKILITNGEFVKEGYRRPDGVWKYGTEEHMKWERLSCHPVTHWMPLPEPPKETT